MFLFGLAGIYSIQKIIMWLVFYLRLNIRISFKGLIQDNMDSDVQRQEPSSIFSPKLEHQSDSKF